MSPRLPTFIDLFAGCGGLSLGFLQAGFRELLAVDSDPQAVQCYNQNLKGRRDRGAVSFDLLRLSRRASVSDFLAETVGHNRQCDVLVGGPPCQSFSIIGRNKTRALVQTNGDLEEYWRQKNRARSALYNVYARFLEVVTPRWFLFENVPAITNHESYHRILRRFRSLRRPNGATLRYNIITGIYNASDYGVPQARRRFVMVGQRSDLGLDDWRLKKRHKKITVAEALNDLPAVRNGKGSRIAPYSSRYSSSFQRSMRRSMPRSMQGWITDHIGWNHNADDVALFRRMAPGARFADPEVQDAIVAVNRNHKLRKYSTDKFPDKLHRLDPQRDCWTVTAHLQKDGYKYIHHRQARTITVREAARLQGFPDWFDFVGFARVPSFRLIGNAVPPAMAFEFARSFIECDPMMTKGPVMFEPPYNAEKAYRIKEARLLK